MGLADVFDTVIVGTGLSGILTAARLHRRDPSKSILLLDKEASLGGRLRGTDREKQQWSYGFDLLTEELFAYWDQMIKQDPEASDLGEYVFKRQEHFGVLAASKLTTCAVQETFSAKGARVVAGAAAARDWTHVDEMLADFKGGKVKDQNFAGAWSSTRKSPSAIVVEQMAKLMGLADVWTAPSDMVLHRAEALNQARYLGRWTEAMTTMLQGLQAVGTVSFRPRSYVASAKYDDKLWQLVTEAGPVTARTLVVAQSPWEAIAWLPKIHWPSTLLHIALKTKPVSTVVLSQVLVEGDGLPDVLYIPAEEVQAMINARQEICFQATLDYELTLQAPAVVKAIKRLRRASAKLQAAMPSLTLSDEHLALLPVAWAQPPSHSDRRWMDKLEEQGFQSKTIGFCGDAYGASCEGDKNTIASVEAVCQKLDF